MSTPAWKQGNAVGLGIVLINIDPHSSILHNCATTNSTVVGNSLLHLQSPKPLSPRDAAAETGFVSSFLKACFLCKKRLSPNNDVYMYRGDQGFCSVECRDHLIFLDERREIKRCGAAQDKVGGRGRKKSQRRGIPAAAC